MLKIRYGSDATHVAQLEADYISRIYDAKYETQYRRFRGLLLNPIIPNTLRELMLAKIDDLARYSFSIINVSPVLRNWAKKFFNYNKLQPKLARFFMANRGHINLATCYYCNISFINAFKDIGEYQDGLDFVKNASPEEIEKIYGIGDDVLNILIAERGTINHLDELPRKPVNKAVKSNINNFILKKEHNHFTLDHVLHKEKHPLISLSLYNLIPSCSSCNEKFKKDKELIIDHPESLLSPTNITFSLTENIEFMILYRAGKTIENINDISDFILDIGYDKNNTGYSRYINMFKLRGRYVFHKNEVLNMIKKVQDYDDSLIKKYSIITGVSPEKIRSDIFGSELFEGNIEDKPLTKLKRDIAGKMGIVGVIK